MDQMPLSAVIFYSIPEEIILFSFGTAIVGEYINFKRVLIAAIISAFTSMLVRAFVPYFGLHSIIGILVQFLLFWILLKIKPWKAIISSQISLIMLILLETITLPIILKSQNFTLEELWKNDLKRIILYYPNLFIYGIITWFLYNKKMFLIKGSRVSNDDEHNDARSLLTFIILFQGVFLALINQHFDYLGNYLFLTKILYIVFFICSILFLKRLYGGDEQKKTQYRDKT